jgi:hypothetical protein
MNKAVFWYREYVACVRRANTERNAFGKSQNSIYLRNLRDSAKRARQAWLSAALHERLNVA